MTTFLLWAPTARASMTTARSVFSRACFISTKSATRSASTASAAAPAASFQRTSSRSRGLVFGVAAAVFHPVVVTFCEKKKNNDDSILSRDEAGNIDWNAVLDNVATMAGEKV